VPNSSIHGQEILRSGKCTRINICHSSRRSLLEVFGVPVGIIRIFVHMNVAEHPRELRGLVFH
jgi:hypothetical protein